MKHLLAALATTVLLAAGPARAVDSVSGTARGVKGAIGCGLLAGELALTIEAAAGVRNPWLLSIIPIVAAGGGAAGGYFLEDYSVEGGVATLALGMTLLVPSIILTLVLISEPTEAPPATALSPATAAAALPQVPLAVVPGRPFVRLADRGLQVQLPSIAVAEAPALSLYRVASLADGYQYDLSLFGWDF